MVILDTSILIDHLRQNHSPDSHFSKFIRSYPQEKLAVSLISIQELFAGQSTLKNEVSEAILAIISKHTILPYTFEAAKRAGEMQRDLANQIEFADAAIAATAILNKAPLCTLNKKDFKGIKGLKLI